MILQSSLFGLEMEAVGYNIILVATIAYAIIALFGLVTVAIFIAVLLKARPILKEYPFFTVVWQLTLSNALNLVAQVTCVVPCTFLDSREQLSKWYEMGANIVDFTDVAVVYFVLLMALNRFAVLVMKPLERMFTKLVGVLFCPDCHLIDSSLFLRLSNGQRLCFIAFNNHNY
uniref:G_PROTEIN_RECEP_F1_2 domain-containing protein n=1 Tax=Angiostrongylus cantonensis TaxID=6313 RepID=A0A0K0DNK8_ANGCA